MVSTVVEFHLQLRRPDGSLAVSKMAFVDPSSIALDDRSPTINSLSMPDHLEMRHASALSRCFESLSAGNGASAPFADGCLVNLLKDSLLHSRLTVIGTISPAAQRREETLLTLQTLQNVRSIKTSVTPQRYKDTEEVTARFKLMANSATNATEAVEVHHECDAFVEYISLSEDERREKADALRRTWIGVRAVSQYPHLVNLANSQANEPLRWPLKANVTFLGRKVVGADDIRVEGEGILDRHCKFAIVDPRVFISPFQDEKPSGCFVNGEEIVEMRELHHNDRVVLGSSSNPAVVCRFVFVGGEASASIPDNDCTYDRAMEELEKKDPFGIALQTALERTRRANELGEKVFQPGEVPLCIPFIISDRNTGGKSILVKITGPQGTESWQWERFREALAQLESFASPRATLPFADKRNPFLVQDAVVVGEGDVWIQALGNMLEVEVDPPILGVAGAIIGKLHLLMTPLDANGTAGPWDTDETEAMDPFVEDPEDLLGQTIRFRIDVPRLHAADTLCGSHVQFQYCLPFASDQGTLWQTNVVRVAEDGVANLLFQQEHCVQVDEEAVRQLRNGKVVFKLVTVPNGGEADEEKAP